VDFLEITFYHNDLSSWTYALVSIFISYLVIRIVKSILVKRFRAISKKTDTDVDDLIVDLINKINNLVLLIVAILIGSLFLNLPAVVSAILQKVLIISLLIQAAISGTGLIQFWVDRYKKSKMAEDAASVTTFTALGFILRMVLWSVILLLALDNLGFNITTLVAGLGVGGIAVALAVQNILSDLFASLSIVLDKPFVIGDFIIIDNHLGSVEHIGLKTTRLRSLSGEQLVISNSDLLKSRIRNFKRMYERRVLISLGVIYQTPLDKLKQIPEMIKDIIEKQESVRFDRAHFKEYGNFSLNFEVVYWVKSPDYNVYMNIQQAINLDIFRQFDENNIEFAYPTQTLFVDRQGLPGD
jgi:small-conductance mechanosensitive channel